MPGGRSLLHKILRLSLVSVTLFAPAAEAEAARPVTVRDAIEMTELSVGLDHGEISTRIPQFSPDGTKFIVVVRKGNLSTNTNDFSMLLFRTHELNASAKPDPILTLSSSSNRLGIQNVTWCNDNESVTFQGEAPGPSQQVYLFNIRTKALHQLTHHPSNVISFSITPDGRTIAYTAESPAQKLFDENAQRNGFLVLNQRLSDLVAGKKGGVRSDIDDHIFVQAQYTEPRAIKVSKIPVWRETPFISPDGAFAVLATQVQTVPDTWRDYSPPVLHKYAAQPLAPGQYSPFARYVLINLRTSEERVLLNSPLYEHGVRNEVAWSPDSKSVVLGSVYLPLEGSSTQEQGEKERRRSTVFTVEIKIPDGGYIPVTSENLHLLRWGVDSNTLIFDGENTPYNGAKAANADPSPEVAFERLGGIWSRLLPAFPSTDDRPTIDEEDDINSPPRLVAKAPHQPKAILLDLNPQFRNLRFAKVEQIAWTASGGHPATGLLYYPVDYQPSKRYPLVIQTHGFQAGRFSINGIADWSPFAAQELAAHNIVVLQTESLTDKTEMGTVREAPGDTAVFEGAIDHLDQIGMIDRDRVGIIGFSHTCFTVKYALTHSKYRFAAAMVVDGIDGGYFQYVVQRASEFSLFSETVNGGPPVGELLQEWLKRSPGFNIDKVTAPVLIGVPRTSALIWEWEWLSLLRALHKPVEMLLLQDGDHPVQRPWERRIFEEYGTVDWFCFWLKEEEDPDPEKIIKYERWRKLRDLGHANSARNQTCVASKER